MTERMEKGKKKWGWLKKLACFFLLALLLAGGWVAYQVYSFTQDIYSQDYAGEDEVKSKPLEGTRLNVLFIGIDTYEQEGSRADVLMLLSLDTDTGEASMLSIPRDTRVTLPGRGEDKINHAHAYGGIPITVQAVESFLELDVNYYARINMQGFKDLVEIIGGVTIDVEPEVAQAEETLEPGVQHLDGSQSLEYVRERKVSGGDFARIERQQKFMLALASQTLKPANILKMPEFMDKLGANFRTNIPLGQLTKLGYQVMRLDMDEVERDRVRGNEAIIGGVYYLIPDQLQVQEQLREMGIKE